MENHIIIDNRNKPLVTNHVQNRDGYQNNGYENYNKQNSGRVNETMFQTPGFIDKQSTSTFRLDKK